MPPTLAKRHAWQLVFRLLKNHLNLSIAFTTRYLAMSSLTAMKFSVPESNLFTLSIGRRSSSML
jgi:hypothetical protein